MIFDHFLKVHLVELVTGKDQYVFAFEWRDMAKALADGISCSLEPGGIIRCLFRCQYIDKCLLNALK